VAKKISQPVEAIQKDPVMSPVENSSLIEYQNSMKNNLSNLASCFSLILIITGLYLLVNGLFGIVNKNSFEPIVKDPVSDNNVDINITPPIIGKIDEEGGISVMRVQAESSVAIQKARETADSISRTHRWRATDYEKGDIGVGYYSVKLGDTLWEIAEAVYGDGAKWIKILENNKNDIGFLEDGSQALIVPGQILIFGK
jgi:hypothetical protein